MAVTKFGPATLEHSDDWRGEVRINRGNESVSIPVQSLLDAAGEVLRLQMIADLQSAKPADVVKFKQRALLTKVS